MSLFVVLEVVRSVEVAVVGEHALGGHTLRVQTQIIVRVLWTICYSFLQLKDYDREQRRYTLSDAVVNSLKQRLCSKATARLHTCSQINGRKHDLSLLLTQQLFICCLLQFPVRSAYIFTIVSGTLGGIIFVHPLRSTMAHSLSLSVCLSRCSLKLSSLAFTDITRFNAGRLNLTRT